MGHHDRLGAAQGLGVLRTPLPGAHGTAGRGGAGLLDRVDVLLALADVDRLAARDSLEHLGQPIEHPAHVAELPDPSAGAVGAALAEVLGHVAHDLKEQVAALVDVVVGRHDGSSTVAGGGRIVEEIGRGQPQRPDHGLEAAASVAVE